jgi:elongation factor G
VRKPFRRRARTCEARLSCGRAHDGSHLLGTDTADDAAIVNAFVPLSEGLEYESKLKRMTQGKSTFTMSIEHLEICPPAVQEKVIQASGFTIEADEG